MPDLKVAPTLNGVLLGQFPTAQDTERRSGTLGAARIATALQYDMQLGDSLAKGAGATIGSTDWATVYCRIENLLAGGLADPGMGLKLCNDDVPFPYTGPAWSDLGNGAVGSTGPSAKTATTPTSNWVLSANGQHIGDTAVFRRALVVYEKQSSGAGKFRASQDGGATDNGADIDTAGTGYGTLLLADTGAAKSRVLKVTQVTTGSVKIIGYVPFQTAATTGLVNLNVSHVGTQASDWTANRGWETLLTLFAPRRLTINLGTNEQLNGVSAATFSTNLTTIVTRAKAACATTEIVIIAPHYSDSASGGVGNATWASTWIPVYKLIAQTNGCTLINEYEQLGDCSNAADPSHLVSVEGVHLLAATQAAQAAMLLDRLSHASIPAPLPAVLTTSVSTAMGNGWKITFPGSGGALWLLDYDFAGDGSVIVPVLGISSAGDSYPRAYLSQSGLGVGDGTAAPPIGFAYGDTSHAKVVNLVGALIEMQGADPTGIHSFVTQQYGTANYQPLNAALTSLGSGGGWRADTNTWKFSSATQIAVPGDASSYLTPGVKVSYNDGAVDYGVVSFVGVSTVALTGVASTIGTSLFTKSGHSLSTLNTVTIGGLVNTTGVQNGKVYWVVNIVGTTFQLADTFGGTAITLGGTADAAITLGTATTFNLIGNTDYSVANAALSAPRYSYGPTPLSFPTSFAYTPTSVSGWTPSATSYRWKTIGRRIIVEIVQTAGTSSSTTHTITAPVTAATISGKTWNNLCRATDNGTVQAGELLVASTGTVITCHGILTGTNTGSGNSAINGSIEYEF